MYIYTFEYISIYIFIYLFTYLFLHIYIYMYVCIYIFIYTYIFTYIYIYMYVCIYIFIYILYPKRFFCGVTKKDLTIFDCPNLEINLKAEMYHSFGCLTFIFENSTWQ